MIYPHKTRNRRTEKCSISQQPWAYCRKTPWSHTDRQTPPRDGGAERSQTSKSYRGVLANTTCIPALSTHLDLSFLLHICNHYFYEMVEWAQCECIQNVRVHPKGESVPNVNAPKMSECPKCQSAPKMSECTQCECAQNVRVHPMWMHPECQSAPNVNAPRMSECAQCECAQNVRVRPMWMRPECQSAPTCSHLVYIYIEHPVTVSHHPLTFHAVKRPFLMY